MKEHAPTMQAAARVLKDLKKAVDPKPPEEPKRFQRDQASVPVTIKGDAEPPKKGSER